MKEIVKFNLLWFLLPLLATAAISNVQYSSYLFFTPNIAATTLGKISFV